MMGLGHLPGTKWPWGGVQEGPKVPKNDENWVFLGIREGVKKLVFYDF